MCSGCDGEEMTVAEWVYDKHGNATLILDGDCIRDAGGSVIAWIHGENVYSLSGFHVGWFEDGVLADSSNSVLGFVSGAAGYTPARPGLSGVPGMPGFAGRPGRPGLAGVPGRPGRGGWSSANLGEYFAK